MLYARIIHAVMQLSIDGIPILPPDVMAPEEQTLRYTSHPRYYAIPSDAVAVRVEDQNLNLVLQEHHEPEPKPDARGNMGKYTITIEAPVSSSSELMTVGSKISELAAELDKFWVYSCGEPLNPVVTQLSFEVTPQGWVSNDVEVRDYLLSHCRQPFAVIKAGPHRHQVWMPYYPLQPALRAWHAYHKADPLIRALVDLHYIALKTPAGEGRLFSFARALELARKIMPGKNDPDREQSLGIPKGKLNRSLHWLFDVGNNRYNTRHVVRRDSAAPALNAPMTGQELVDYQENADLVLRTLVCQRLQISTPQLLPSSAMAARNPAQA